MLRVRQQIFTEAALALRVLDAATLARLLNAVPEPEDAAGYLHRKQLITDAKNAQLQAAYRKALAESPEAQRDEPSVGTGFVAIDPPPLPGSEPEPTVPPRPSKNKPQSEHPRPSRPPADDDGFDSMIEDIFGE